MAYDIFGNELQIGDVVVYSNAYVEDGDMKLSLESFVVTDVIDEKTAMGHLLHEPYWGTILYLVDTHLRCSLVENVYETIKLEETTLLN